MPDEHTTLQGIARDTLLTWNPVSLLHCSFISCGPSAGPMPWGCQQRDVREGAVHFQGCGEGFHSQALAPSSLPFVLWKFLLGMLVSLSFSCHGARLPLPPPQNDLF